MGPGTARARYQGRRERLVALAIMSRVLLVLQEDTLGGSTLAVLRPLEVLLERGWEVSIWCSKPSPLYDDLVAQGYRVDGAPRLMKYRISTLRHPPGIRRRLMSLPRSLAAFRRHLRAHPPDLVHANGRRTVPEALVARVAGFRVVTCIHDGVLPGLRGAIGRIGPWVASDAVFAMSASHAETVRLGRRRPGILVGSAPMSAPVARRLRPPHAATVVGTIGVVSPRKGTDVFIDMAEQLRAQGHVLDLRIAGGVEDGPLQPWAERELERARQADVRWLGQVDVARELREWDIMVMPSRVDPFPLAVLEAMRSAVAIVGCAVDGIGEQLEGGVGLLVPGEDAAALTRAVLGLAADPARRAELGAAGHARYLERFTPERAADALEAAWRANLPTAAGRRRRE
jgi:glycosyltransferase involved in cell wall biosynthesis